MNDFTKEELRYIAEAIECRFKDYDSETPERIYLKVKFMIDNYCEHEYKKTLDKSGMYFINLCHKCIDRKPWSNFIDSNKKRYKEIMMS